MRPTLDELAIKYDTDKSTKAHAYTILYDRHFSSLRDESVRILEIGIQNGFSLKTWKEYFPQGKIVGIDIVDLKHLEEDRVSILKGSQSDTKFLIELNASHGPFDIIIDDGSHYSTDIKASFYCLFPLLKSGGIYVVEDLHTNYWERSSKFPDWYKGKRTETFVDEIKKLMDKVNAEGKTGYANRALDKEKVHGRLGELDWWDTHIDSITLYRSIAKHIKHHGKQ